MNITPLVLSLVRVVGSSLGKGGKVLYELAGHGYDDDTEEKGTRERNLEEFLGVPNFYTRPPADEEQPPEGIAANIGDELITISATAAGPINKANAGTPDPVMPKAGQAVIVGWGGGFMSFEKTGASDLFEVYIPAEKNGQGVPTEALSIQVNPATKSIAIVHPAGLAITIDEDRGIVLRADASTRLVVKPGRIEIIAAEVIARGSVVLGSTAGVPGTNLPAIMGPSGIAGVPSQSVKLSP